jgi:glycosyltransferase involved in cell wall biosynthesis
LSQCDCGIIPINPKNKMAWYKPANKLISFWFAGVPTIVTATPAYSEIMGKVNSNLYCSNTEEWIEKIINMRNMSPQERENLSNKNLSYVQAHFSDEQLTLNWSDVFKYVREGALVEE